MHDGRGQRGRGGRTGRGQRPSLGGWMRQEVVDVEGDRIQQRCSEEDGGHVGREARVKMV